jgi:hypothetical protein
MADPVGQWQFNANGYRGTLTITSDGAGNLSGTVDYGIGVILTIQGVWSEVAQEIVFQLTEKQGNTIINVQSFTGHLFSSNEPILGGYGRPVVPTTFLVLSGSYEAIGSGAKPGHPRFGWIAGQHITTIS